MFAVERLLLDQMAVLRDGIITVASDALMPPEYVHHLRRPLPPVCRAGRGRRALCPARGRRRASGSAAGAPHRGSRRSSRSRSGAPRRRQRGCGSSTRRRTSGVCAGDGGSPVRDLLGLHLGDQPLPGTLGRLPRRVGLLGVEPQTYALRVDLQVSALVAIG